jgi:hypothetical protein
MLWHTILVTDTVFIIKCNSNKINKFKKMFLSRKEWLKEYIEKVPQYLFYAMGV